MNSIFLGYQQLIALDIPNLNLDKIIIAEDMFNNITNLKYIFLNNIKIKDEVKNKLDVGKLIELNLIVFQSE